MDLFLLFDNMYTIYFLHRNSTSIYFLMWAWLLLLWRLKKFDQVNSSRSHLLRHCSKYKLIYFYTSPIYMQSVFFFNNILRSLLCRWFIINKLHTLNTFFKLEFFFSNYNCFYIFNWFLYNIIKFNISLKLPLMLSSHLLKLGIMWLYNTRSGSSYYNQNINCLISYLGMPRIKNSGRRCTGKVVKGKSRIL